MHKGDHASRPSQAYVAPKLMDVGSLRELTLGCDKTFGSTDGYTFQGQGIVCTSA